MSREPTFQRDVEAALRRLIAQASRGVEETGWHKIVVDLFDDTQISWMAQEYIDFVFASRRTEPTRGDALPLIDKCKRQTLELSTTLNMLRGTAWAQLRESYQAMAPDGENLDFSQLDRTLVLLHLAAASTVPIVEGWPTRKGAVPDTRPVQVARVAAAQYYRITRREPSRTVEGKTTRGPFAEFLSEVFAALGITASIDAHAREAAGWWRSHDSHNLLRSESPSPPG